MKNFMKASMILLLCLFCAKSNAQFNYGEALQKSLLFYETQQSGVLPDWNRISWRSDSGVNDGDDVGLDLTGGWNDAGDHVKFGFPMAFSVTALNWGFLEYQDGYDAANQTEHFKRNIKWVTDYFIKCHPSPNVFYAQVADSKSQDHNFWMPAEMVDVHPSYGQRLSYALTTSNPGTEVACETAAALASASIIFKDSDPAYSATLLSHAIELYEFGDNHRGLYTTDGGIPALGTYTSGNYQDELTWGALWLYKATGEQKYLDKAEAEYAQPDFLWSLVWEDKSYGNMVLLSILTDKEIYKTDAERHLDWWQEGSGGVSYSPGGQAHLTQWGSLRHAMNASLTALIYSDNVDTPKKNQYHDFAVAQVNYALGDNPNNRSLVTGFGVNPPTKPHHRGQHSSWSRSSANPVESRHTMWGALMGGPGMANDAFEEDRDDFQANEVAVDYNACYQGVLARMTMEFGGSPIANFPPVETPGLEFANEVKLNNDQSLFTEVSIWLNNRSGWPARVPNTLKARYFVDISEGIAAGYSVSDYELTARGAGSTTTSGLQEWDADANIYYAEIEVDQASMPFPGGQGEYRSEIQLRVSLPTDAPASAWDASNDFSYQGLTSGLQIADNVPIYVDGALAGGNEPTGGEVPSASFTATPETGTAPLEVSFDASASSDPNGDSITYSWDFGNGETSTTVDPLITFTEIGTYLVTLTVSDGENTSSEVTKEITVEDGNIAPIADFTATPTTGIAPVIVSFDAAASSDENGDTLSYTWDFGDGETGSGETVDHEYTAIGEYSVVLTVSDGSKEGTKTSTITVTDGSPVAAFTASTESGIAPLEVTFDASESADPAGGDLTYSWDLGNGETATAVTASATYTTVGTKTVVLTVTNASGDTDSVSKTINVTDGSVSCAFGTPTATSLPNINTFFENIYVLGEGGPDMDIVNKFTINWDLANNGLYQFSFNLNASPWYVNFSESNQNFNEPSPSITLTETGIAGLDGSYYATVDEGNFVLVSQTGGFTIYFSASATAPDCGSTTVTNGVPVASLTATPTSGIAPLEVSFDASASTDEDGDTLTYTIDYGDGNTGTGVTSTHIYTEVGEYTAEVTANDGNGGSSTFSVEISVEEEIVNPTNIDPIAALTATPVSGTAPLEVSFDASASTDEDGDTLTYAVDYGDGTSGTEAISSHIYTAGDYTATVTVNDGNGGSDTTSVAITVEEDVVTPPGGDCTFGTPLATALPNVNTSFDYTYVLGSGGPNLDNVSKFTINWDLANNGLYQFAFNLNASPWYVNFSEATQNFNGSTPSITLAGTGISGLDGSYYAAVDEGNFVLVSITGGFTIYFSSSATVPDCGDSTGGNINPIADISADVTAGEAPLVVNFDASGSTDEDGDALSYSWDFGDGNTATGVTVENTFTTIGSYDVTLTVTDGNEGIDQAIISINVTDEIIIAPPTGDNVYIDRFTELRNEIYDPANGYFSADGSPHHSIETLIVEAPDYGHESTSELYSYWMWMEVMHGRISGDWAPLNDVWEKTEQFIIPTNADQPTNAAYSPSSPAAYAAEFPLPSGYPSPLSFTAPVGVDPVSSDLTATYGADIYQMHWLLDNDNFYGYGNRGDGVSTPSYINTFQRGEQESVYETVPHPSWESFDWGGTDGFLPLFVDDSNYSQQWRYTSAPDADARAVQAMYWAQIYAKEQGASLGNLDLDKASKMGDYLRLSMFDKYFKPLGVQSATSGAGTGYDSAHYLMSWYMSWGGAADTSSPWAFRISSSHCHFGYQNPVAAYALTQVDELKPISTNGERDWNESLQRQMEFYTWLQSSEGGIAGGATNSWNGDYSPYPAGKSTFYDMAYDTDPVYHDPGSGTWFGWQAWSMERVAEYYYITNDPMAKNLMDKWTTWVESEVQLVGEDDFLIPATLEWTGEPDTWNPDSPGSNAGLSVSVVNYSVDLGIAASMSKALIYYAAATAKYGTLDEGAKDLAKEVLDRMWNKYRDEEGLSSTEARGDFSRIFEEEVYIPEGFSGVMANGDAIVPGVSFLDLRSGYRDDPEFGRLEAAYEAGEDFTQNYHRTWAQMEIALANAEYGFFFGDEEAKKAPSTKNVVNTYPNPVKDILNISSNFDMKNTLVRIVDIAGRVVKEFKLSNKQRSNQISLEELPTGLYVMKTLDLDTNTEATTKLIKE
ncbi:hypothetical protein GCM10022393_40880 [Aquimarina addita]|uniref:PKD domain-containing protein n=1 Tax=Aquimarina addita TaxID=870485 RepID=A0ABP6UTL4_9FLAO